MSGIDEVIRKEKEAALASAIASGNLQVGLGLIRHEVSANAKTDWGAPMLSAAVTAKSIEFVEALLEHGADPNATGHHGATALAEAIFAGGTRIAAALLDAGADLNTSCYTCTAPLDLAARKGNEPMIRLLLERGARVPAHMRDPEYWVGRDGVGEEVRRLIASHALAQGLDDAMPENGAPPRRGTSEPAPL